MLFFELRQKNFFSPEFELKIGRGTAFALFLSYIKRTRIFYFFFFFFLPLSQIFGVSHSRAKTPLDMIFHTICTKTNNPRIIVFNRIKLLIFRSSFSSFPLRLTSITVLTVSDSYLHITCPNHLSLFFLILSTIAVITRGFLLHIHSLHYVLSSLHLSL